MDGDQTFFVDDRQTYRPMNATLAETLPLNTEYDPAFNHFSSPQPQKSSMFFNKNENLIQSPKILYNGDQKVKAYRA